MSAAVENMHRVFVYGTLKRGEPNHKLLTDSNNGVSVFRGKAKTVDKYPLVIASRFNLPFLMHAKGKGKTINGEIFDVNDSMLARLDILEEHPKLYERLKCEVIVTSDGVDENGNELSTDSSAICWIYFLRKYKPQMLELPYMDNYSSRGQHGLAYDESEDLSDPELI